VNVIYIGSIAITFGFMSPATHSCQVPCDGVSMRGWPLFRARALLQAAIEYFKVHAKKKCAHFNWTPQG
jgi:hypothetical protein